MNQTAEDARAVTPAQIEAVLRDARRMRAETLGQGLRWVARAFARLARRRAAPQAVREAHAG